MEGVNAEKSGTVRGTTLLYAEESFTIRAACFAVYTQFRNTQKEIIYKKSLIAELRSKNMLAEEEKRLPIYYFGIKVGVYIPDIVVNNRIFLELKAKPFIHSDDIKQFWYYLKNSQFKLGFLVNFGEQSGVRIIRRVYDTSRPPA